MLKKGFVIVILTFLYVFFPFYPEMSAFAQEPDDPAAQLPSEEGTPAAQSEVTPYTAEEFANLPDDQIRDVYFNSPELLPPNFEPNDFKHIVHSNLED